MARHNHEPISTVDTDLPQTPEKDNVSRAQYAVPTPREPAAAAWLKKTINKLGFWQMSVLLFGNIALIFAIAVLWYIWTPTGRRNSAGSVWESVVFSDWILRVITLTSIIIRTAMTMQATVFCMVVASITLQRSGVLFRDAAAVSIYRFTNSGPHNMILPLFSAQKGWKSDIAMVMTALLSLTTICSQFTSTILLMDIGTAWIETPARNFDVAYGANPNQSETGEFKVSSFANSWTERPSDLPIFAEKASENTFLQNQENGGGVFATGSTIRALLPLEKKDRDSLAEYIGPAAVIDSRVFCIPPYIHALTLEWGTSIKNARDNMTYYYINATVGIDTFVEHSDKLMDNGFLINELTRTDTLVQFYCKSPSILKYPLPFYEWPLALCALATEGLESVNSTDADIFDGSFDQTWMVMNMTGYQVLWENVTVNASPGYGDSVQGEWTTLSYESPIFDEQLHISLSLCFSSSASRNFRVTARADWNLTEPILVKDADKIQYNSTAIRKFVGVETGTKEDLNHEKRGMADLINIDMGNQLSVIDNWIPQSLVDTALNQSLWAAATAMMCIWCEIDVSIHEGYVNIFENTLRETTHPALAIQALMTTRALQIYEGRRMDLVIPDSARLNIIEPFQVPVKTSGFWAILSLIVFHMLLMLYVVVMFFQMEGYTSLGQSWQAVSQLEGQETIETMAFAKKATDSEVRRWFVEKGIYKERVVIKEGSVVRKKMRGNYEYSRAPGSNSSA